VQPFVYRKDVAGEEFEGRGRHRPARRDRTLTAKGRKWRRCCRPETYLGAPSRYGSLFKSL